MTMSMMIMMMIFRKDTRQEVFPGFANLDVRELGLYFPQLVDGDEGLHVLKMMHYMLGVTMDSQWAILHIFSSSSSFSSGITKAVRVGIPPKVKMTFFLSSLFCWY